VRHLNLAGAHLGPGYLAPLSAGALLDEARDLTGLFDFGDEGFEEGLRVLVDALNSEAKLTLTGRLISGLEIRRVLQSRLRLIEFEKQHPSVADEPITEPIFIVGMGRTGSTILHEYLAADEAHRAPLVWEMRLPCPLDETSSADIDRALRIDWSDAETELFYDIDPSLRTKHEQRSDLPEECSQLMAYEFRSGHFFSRNNVPSYAAWNAGANIRPALEMHRRILKVLQFQAGRRARWVLKYGGHMPYLPELLEIYPDARIIHTHRDPVAVVRSFVSLMASTRLMRSDEFDAASAAEMLNAGMCRAVEKIIAERTSGQIPAATIADIHFSHLMANPVAEIQRAYAALDLPFTTATAAAIANYAATHPRGEHGGHDYAYADVIDLDRERKRYAGYMHHYAIESEVASGVGNTTSR
jgi:hypothetical protein